MILRKWTVRTKKIQHLINREVSKAIVNTENKMEIKKTREIGNIILNYENLLAEKERRIRRLEKQHDKDIKAREKYRADEQRLKDFLDNLQPRVKQAWLKFAEGYKILQGEQDQIDSIFRISEGKEGKIKKLYGIGG